MSPGLTENLNMLNQAVLKAVNASSEQEIVKDFIEFAIEVLSADYGFSFFKNSTTQEFEFVYKDPRTPFDPTMPRKTGVTQEAFEKKVPVYTSNYSQSNWLIDELSPYIKGFVCIPITYLNNNYGTLNICYKDEHEFTKQDESLCVFIGNCAAQAITISRLMQSEHTALMHAEEQKERFRALIENSYDVVAVMGQDGQITYISPSVQKLTGYKMDVLMGKYINEVIHPEDVQTVALQLQTILLNPSTPQAVEFRFQHQDGTWNWVEANAINMLGNPSVEGVVVNMRGITQRKQSEEIIKKQAMHDSLTSLPNRQEMTVRIKQALEEAQRHKRQLAVMFVDIDRFKNVNDALGHGVGDTLLRVMASRFSSCVRKEDMVARLGGDEFVILLNEIQSGKDAVAVAKKILKAINVPVRMSDHTIHPSVSIGIAVYPEDAVDKETLLRHADTALYRAKQAGRNRYQLYDNSMQSYATEKFALENQLRQALLENQIILYYQPIISLKRKQIVAVEALARWQHPQRGLLLPSEFIPLVEERGLIQPFTEHVLRLALSQQKLWEVAGFPKFRVAVNLSAQQFSEVNFISEVANMLNECQVEPHILEMEITESLAMGNLELTNTNLKELKRMGVHITIDDFGTGYSSLGYLKNYPINALKIDKSFVRQCITSGQDASIVRTIVSMAHNLNLKVIAEGVETEQQLNFLTSLGCDAAQGFYISHPMSPEYLENWLMENNYKKAPNVQSQLSEPLKTVLIVE